MEHHFLKINLINFLANDEKWHNDCFTVMSIPADSDYTYEASKTVFRNVCEILMQRICESIELVETFDNKSAVLLRHTCNS